MSRRSRNTTSISLFSFQDIITATTGILILLALVLALSVIIQGAESQIEVEFADADTIAYRDSLIDEVQQLKQQSDDFAKELGSLSSATPEDLRKKIKAAEGNIERLKNEIRNKKAELAKQDKQLKSQKKQSTSDQDRAKLEELLKEIQTTKSSLGKLSASNRIVYNFRNTSKTAWLVEISGVEILAAKVASSGPPKKFRSVYQFNKFAVGLSANEQYFVLILKPSGVSNFDRIKAYLAEKNLDMGTELIGEDQIVVDPLKGANF